MQAFSLILETHLKGAISIASDYVIKIHNIFKIKYLRLLISKKM